MQIIAFAGFKGGSGKTTTLMAAASSLVERGNTVALLETDDNAPMAAWKRYGEELGTWAPQASVHTAFDLDALDGALQTAESAGADIALTDTRGGGSDLNQMVLMNASLVVIPTGLSVIEVDEALATLRYVAQLLKQVDMNVPVGLLINRISTARLSSTEAYSLDILADLPVFNARLPDRQVFADIKIFGLLHPYHRKLMATPAKRIAATHSMIAANEADTMTTELLETMAQPVAAA